MIKKLLFVAILATALFSNSFDINSNVSSLTLEDQFEKEHTLPSDTKMLIVSSEKNTSAALNEFLASKEEGFLEKNKTVFIANLSGMPSIITKIFALPKMKKYNYSVLLIHDEDDKRFSYKEEKLTIYTIENGIIKAIKYIDFQEIPSLFIPNN